LLGGFRAVCERCGQEYVRGGKIGIHAFTAPTSHGCVESELARWADVVRSVRFARGSEAALQDALMEHLARHLVGDEVVIREVELSPEDRIDFLVGGTLRIGVEVKVDGATSALVRQLQRYAQHETIAGLLVVSTRAHHRAVPSTLSGKPVVVASLLYGGL
jgi:hypothetical protein